MNKIYSLFICFALVCSCIIFNTEVVAADYYAGIDLTDSSDDIFDDLESLITSTHTYKSYGSSYNDILAEGAETSEDSTTMTLFYTGYVDSKTNGGGANVYEWNKEHVWPKSLTGGESSAPANDIHNIRPTNTKINSTRSNLPFGELSSSASVAYGAYPYATDSTYCYYSSSAFEPRDEVKGDCARIIFYILVRYDYLSAVDIDDIGDMDMFLQWHYDDPVDEYEMNLNEACYDYQGNRNPFIDHEEYVDILWPNDYGTSFEELDDISIESSISSDLSLPTSVSGYDITWSSSDTSVISNAGVVTQGVVDTVVEMKASITKDGVVGSKTFSVTVLDRDLTAIESFMYSTIFNSLIFDYTLDSEEVTSTAYSGSITNSDTYFNFDSGVNYASYFDFDDSVFGLYEESKTGSYGASFYKTETFTIKSGAVARIECYVGNIESITLNYSASDYGGTLISTSTTGGVEASSGDLVSVSGSNVVYLINDGSSDDRIVSMSITYISSEADYTISNAGIRFAMETNDDVVDLLDNCESYGLIYSKTDSFVGSSYSSLSDVSDAGLSIAYGSKSYDDYVSFVFTNLDVDSLSSVVYTAFFVITEDGELVISNNKDMSFISVVESYLELIDSGLMSSDEEAALLPHEDILEALASSYA